MAERRPSLMEPRIETLMGKVDSKFTLVTLAAMRAREINDYYNQLGEGLGRIVPPQVTSVSRKPLSIALEEVVGGKIVFERIEPRRGGRRSAARRGRRPRAPTPPPERGRRAAGAARARVRCPESSSASAAASPRTRRSRSAAGSSTPACTSRRSSPTARSVRRRARRSPRSRPNPRAPRCSAAPEPIPHTRLGQTADLDRRRARDRQAARQVRGRHLRRPAHRDPARDARAGARVPGDAHRDVGAPGGAGEPRDAARAAACTCSPPEEGRLAGGDVGAGRLADPERDRRPPRSALLAARAVRSPGARCSSPPAAPARRSTRSASSATARRGRWATRWPTSRPRAGRAGRARHHRGAAGRRRRRGRRGRERRGDARRGHGRAPRAPTS